MSELVKQITDSSFEKDVLQSEQPVLVDFWAPCCDPCRKLGPVVETVAAQHKDVACVVKLNVDDNVSSSQRYGIKGIPTLILFRDGKEAGRIVGAASEKTISGLIERHSIEAVAA